MFVWSNWLVRNIALNMLLKENYFFYTEISNPGLSVTTKRWIKIILFVAAALTKLLPYLNSKQWFYDLIYLNFLSLFFHEIHFVYSASLSVESVCNITLKFMSSNFYCGLCDEEIIGFVKVFVFWFLMNLHSLQCLENDLNIFEKCLSVSVCATKILWQV